MPRAQLTTAERKARAERNRMARALGQPTSRENGDAAVPPNAYKPIPGGPLEANERLLDELDKLPQYAGGESLTEDQLRFICKTVRIGNFPHHVAAAIGIPESTWKNWMDKGRKGVMPYAYMWVQVQKARATAILTLVQTIRKASDTGNWTAAARMLESFASADWMKTERHIEEAGGQYKEMLEELAELRRKRLGTQQSTVDTTATEVSDPKAIPV